MTRSTLFLVAVLVMATFAAAPAPGASARNAFGHHPDTGVPDSEILVAVIDTGADGTHPEFGGYRGQAGVSDPQIVAWWDFAEHGVPGPGVTWDEATPVPYDSCAPMCHGTGTASLVGGKTVGAFPGVKLAIAKVGDETGNLDHIPQAIEWAVKTVGADVVSMSFGYAVPVPGAIHDMDEAVAEAASLGVLMVASAGNGFYGVKMPGEGHAPSNAPDALMVGAAGQSGSVFARAVHGYFSNTDPDVVSWGTEVRMATEGGRYHRASGTSFSAPLVAGWSARVMQHALDYGQPADGARVKQILLGTADDHPLVPYALEGHGYVGDGDRVPVNSLTAALRHAREGTLPAPPALEPHAAGTASRLARVAINEAEPVKVVTAVGSSTPGHVAPSAPTMRDADAYVLPLSAGDVVELTVRFSDAGGVNDLDVFLYRAGAGANGVFSDNDIAASSTHGTAPGLNEEQFMYTAATDGAHALLLEGWLVGAGGQAYSLHVSVNGNAVTPEYLGDHMVVRAGY